jgi:hypothetical protein
MSKLRVFVSSVQKELEIERVAIASLITTDPWLLQHCEPVLFEKEPAPARKSSQPYLKCLESCQIYLLLIHKEYGKPDGSLSATPSRIPTRTEIGPAFPHFHQGGKPS